MMNRRGFIIGALALGGCVPAIVTRPAKRIAVTMDDFNIAHKHKAAGFVTGRMVDNVFGDEVVKSWSNAGHLIGSFDWKSHLQPFEFL